MVTNSVYSSCFKPSSAARALRTCGTSCLGGVLVGLRAMARPSRPTRNFSKFQFSGPLSLPGSAFLSKWKTPELEGQHADECVSQLPFADVHFPLTFDLANILNFTALDAANAATSSFVPGSCCPNSLHGKARISSPEDANSVCRSTSCASTFARNKTPTLRSQRHVQV